MDKFLLARQRDTLTHRGPDGAGLWVSESGKVGFGHRRLAIIDLSEAGRQPMTHAPSGCTITFNGEIYNFQELRSALEARGHRFVSHSDTEVILAAYVEWGDSALARLQGMFALALFDPRRNGVLLARDRAGEKPLYLYRGTGFLHFASEIKALWADPRVPRRLAPGALDELLGYGYGPPDQSLIQGITKLPPASALWIDLESGTERQWTYWSLPDPFRGRTGADPRALEDQAESLMLEAVRRQMIADVPLGILLSGGLDSSLVAALAVRARGSAVKTFTVSFPDSPAHDESGFARQVAEFLGTEHIQIDAAPATSEDLQALAIQFDEPIGDSSMLPTFLVSKAIRQHATVALGGDGGDELFGGYLRHSGLVALEGYRSRVPSLLRSLAAAAAQVAPENLPGKTTLTGLGYDTSVSVALAGRLLSPEARRRLSPDIRQLPPSGLGLPETRRAKRIAGHGSVLQQATTLDFTEYMVSDVLTKVDRASMLASLEVRAPLLDPSLVEFAFGSLPDTMRATSDERKIILRRLASRLLPPGFDSTRKQGFSIPLQRWIASDWNGLVREAIDQSPEWLLDRNACRSLLSRVEAGGRGADAIFGFVTLSLWANHYRVTA